MDCKITENYLKEKARMSRYDAKVGACRAECENCPLSSLKNGKGLICYQLEKEYPEDAIAIVQKWSDEHQCKCHDCVIREYNDYDDTRVVTYEDLKEEVVKTNRIAKLLPSVDELKFADFFNLRKSSSLTHFTFCPVCGQRIE